MKPEELSQLKEEDLLLDIKTNIMYYVQCITPIHIWIRRAYREGKILKITLDYKWINSSNYLNFIRL